MITYCPCGCGKEDHNGGSGDSSASSTGGTPGSLPSPNNFAAIVNAATNLTSLQQHNQNNTNHFEQHHQTTKYPESPDLSPVKPFQLSSSPQQAGAPHVPTTSITQPPFHLLQPVPASACTSTANTISPQSSSSSYSSSEVPLDMSKTSPMFIKTSSSSETIIQQQAKVCSIQTPPPTPPENDRDKFRCLYLLVDAAMEQLEEITAEKRRHSSQQEVTSLQITTHNPPTQQPPQLATLLPHQRICA